MRLPEFIINLFTKYAPVDPATMATLKIQLSEQFNKVMSDLKTKEARNESIEEKQRELKRTMDAHDPHTQEYQDANEDYFKFEKQKESPTIWERVVSFFEKPWVKVVLLVAFVIASRWIAKKLTEPTDKEKDDEDLAREQENTDYGYRTQPHQQYGNYPPPPSYWNPYGWNPGYPPQHYPGKN